MFAIVDVKGFSLTTYRFQIDCQDKEYTAEEISKAKIDELSMDELIKKLNELKKNE